MGKLENKINQYLNCVPRLKKGIKRIYQLTMYSVSSKIKSEGNIVRVSPNDSKEYFFGYYDKSPWDISDRYILCMRANNTWSEVSPKEKADILLIDTTKRETDPERVKKIAETRAWNVQQSCMLQWLGPDYSNRILYNDFRDGKYVSVILTLATKEEKVIPFPVYSVAADGSFALSLDFSRLYRLRPGYGYYNVPEATANEKLPDKPCIWRVDLNSGEVKAILKYTDFAKFEPRPEMEGAEHKVNHIMLSPSGKRFMVLYRWFQGQRKYTRLVTCNVDGTDMYNLSDDDMVSHCFWKNDDFILAFGNKKKTGTGYYLMKDKTQKYIHCWPQFSNDGHPSYSPNGKLIVTDSYPDRARIASINLMDGDERKKKNTTIARVFAPFKYDNDTRCDLHPRWNHRGDTICFDSTFEGHRGLYTVNIGKNEWSQQDDSNNLSLGKDDDDSQIKYSIITPMYNSFDLMKRYFQSLKNQTYQNFEVIIIDDSSTDDSYEKMIKYVNELEIDVKVYQTEKNSGPGVARNIGMSKANGQWITFIDNDDWVDENLLKKINNVIIKNDVNCVIYDYYTSNGKTNKECRSMYVGEQGVIHITDCIKNIRNHSVGKFYKKSCISEIRYTDLRRCEDVAFVCQAVDACERVYYLRECLYYYYQRSSSLSNNKNLDETEMIKAFCILDDAIGKKYPNEIKEKSVSDLLYGVLLMMCKSGKSSKEIIEYINNYELKYTCWYKKEYIRKLGKAKDLFLYAAHTRQIILLKLLTKIHERLIG